MGLSPLLHMFRPLPGTVFLALPEPDKHLHEFWEFRMVLSS